MNELNVQYISGFLSGKIADQLFFEIDQSTKWKQEKVKIFGKEVKQPRLTAWAGEVGIEYRYSGLSFISEGWTEPILEMRKRLKDLFDVEFNGVLLNRYADGNDYMGWHSDDESMILPLIASISLGAERKFVFRKKDNLKEKHYYELEHGSCLLMRAPTQQYYQHTLPKQMRIRNPRINLTFRIVVPKK